MLPDSLGPITPRLVPETVVFRGVHTTCWFVVSTATVPVVVSAGVVAPEESTCPCAEEYPTLKRRKLDVPHWKRSGEDGEAATAVQFGIVLVKLTVHAEDCPGRTAFGVQEHEGASRATGTSELMIWQLHLATVPG